MTDKQIEKVPYQHSRGRIRVWHRDPKAAVVARPVPERCGSCGRIVDPGYNTCPSCGYRLRSPH